MSLCLKDIKEGGLSSQLVINNLNCIIEYAIRHLEWTIRTMNSCRNFLAFVSVSVASGQKSQSQNSEMKKVFENLFYLENMKPKISSSSPFLENIPLNQDMAVLKLTLLFHRYYFLY
jgi:hypothetical protein